MGRPQFEIPAVEDISFFMGITPWDSTPHMSWDITIKLYNHSLVELRSKMLMPWKKILSNESFAQQVPRRP